MKKSLPLIFLVLFGFSQAKAQSDRFKKKGSSSEPKSSTSQQDSPAPSPEAPETFWDKLVYGGGAGLSLGENTNIFLAPQVGYKFTDNLTAGLGYMYNYARWTSIFTVNGFQEVDYTNQIHGPNLFANFGIWETIFVGTQVEYLNHDYYRYNLISGSFDVENTWTPVLFLQGGYMQKVGTKGQMLIGARINLLHDITSPYSTSWSPIFQVYF